MDYSNIKNKILKNSIKDTDWISETKARHAKEDWLEYSFNIYANQ